jgi:hypothetical protein
MMGSDGRNRLRDAERETREESAAMLIRANRNGTVYCEQGHPAHDPTKGCGPCRDECDAGYGFRHYAEATER